MTNIEIIYKLQEVLRKRSDEISAAEDLFEMLRIYERENEKEAHEINKEVRKLTAAQVRGPHSVSTKERFYNLHKRALLFDAKQDFDAYLQYIEFDREPRKRFYLPRRKQILPVIQALQGLEDDKYDLVSISLPPGVGKTTSGAGGVT